MLRTIIVLILTPIIAAKIVVDPIIATINNINTVSGFANNILSLIKGEDSIDSFDDMDSAFKMIAEKLLISSAQLEEMEANNEEKMDRMLTTIMNRLSKTDKDEIGLYELRNYTFCVDCIYEKYKEYLEKPESFRSKKVKMFIEIILFKESGDLSLILEDKCKQCTQHLRHLSAVDRTSIQEGLHEVNKKMSFEKLCGTSSSPQQRLFEIYRSVFISEAREYVMNIFSLAILMVEQKISYAAKMEELASKLVERTRKYLIETKKVMEDSSLAVDLCDPKIFERGKNFIELEGAIQMYIVNEINLSSDDNSNECSKDCPDYKNSLSVITEPKLRKKNNWHPLKPCHGHISDCVSASNSKVCEMPYDSLERYTWVEDKYHNTYGNTKSCSGRIKYPEPFELHNYTCDICICTCVEDMELSTAIRSVSLRPVLSNIEKNRIVTGIRFILSNNMIQIQVEEGELLPGGCITEHSEKWVKSEEFQCVENEIFDDTTNGEFYLISDDDEEIVMERDKDFAFITNRPKTIILDELVAPPNYVITGVKLQYQQNSDENLIGRPLQLAIKVTKFDFTKGLLSTEKDNSYWMWNDNQQGSEIDLSAAERPTKLHGHTQISEPGQFVKFTASDYKKDAGQSTVPFFDGQGVITSISIPLSGLRLLHRGAPGSGGFLAFRLLTLNLSQYINTELTE